LTAEAQAALNQHGPHAVDLEMLSRESTKINNKKNENAALPDNISKIRAQRARVFVLFIACLGVASIVIQWGAAFSKQH
jgi:hypothetical protein